MINFVFLILAALLFIGWLGAFAFAHVTSAAIHVLLVLALVSLVLQFVRRRRVV